jgi:hypothetical protein
MRLGQKQSVVYFLEGLSALSSDHLLFQIERIEALGKPAVDRSEKLAGLISLALIAPEEEGPRYLAPVVHSFSARSGNLPASRIQF